MMFYSVIIGLPILHTRIREFFKSKWIDFCFILLLSVLLSIRSGVGVDYDTYTRVIYDWYKGGHGILDPISYGETFELGFSLVYYTIVKLNLPYNVALFIFAFFNITVLFYFLDKINIKHKLLAIVVYVLIFDIYVYSLAAIRQSLAISFYMLTILSLNERELRKAIGFMVLGFLFHWSIVIMAPFLYFVYKKKAVKVITLLMGALVSPYLYMFLMSSNLVDILSRFKYNLEYYLIILSEERLTNMNRVYLFMVISVVFVYLLATEMEVRPGLRIKVSSARLLSEVEMDVLHWSIYFFLITKEWLAISYLSALPRLQMYWYFLLPFWVARFMEKIDLQTRKIVSIATAIVLIALFIGSLNENAEAYRNAMFVFL